MSDSPFGTLSLKNPFSSISFGLSCYFCENKKKIPSQATGSEFLFFEIGAKILIHFLLSQKFLLLNSRFVS
jgi:hypothetical protein